MQVSPTSSSTHFSNAWTEVLRFADRHFYGNWWSATDATALFKHWNLIIKHWIVDYVYAPLIKRGSSRLFAGTLVSLSSSVLHDYVYTIATGFLNPLSFYVFIVLMIPGLVVQALAGRRGPAPASDQESGGEERGATSDKPGSHYSLQITLLMNFLLTGTFAVVEYWSRVNCPLDAAAAGNATLAAIVTGFVVPRSLSCVSFDFTCY